MRLRPSVVLFAVWSVVMPLASRAAVVGDVAPTFDLERVGRPGLVDLARYRGHPVFLNFYTAWCWPCEQEAPEIDAIDRAFRKRGLVTIGIDVAETPDVTSAFVARIGWTFPQVVDANGALQGEYDRPRGRARTELGGTGIPYHVLIDRRGRIRYAAYGETDYASIAPEVDELLATGARPARPRTPGVRRDR